MELGKKSASVRCRLMAVATLLVSIALLPAVTLAQASATSSATSRAILVLYWYNKDFPGNVAFDQSFQAVLQSTPTDRVEYYTEFLETNRFPGENQERVLRDYLRQKYAHRTINVVVAAGDATLDFLLKYRADLFPDTPILFGSVRSPAEALLSAGPGMTGLINHQSYRENLDLLLKLHADTEQVFIISGTLNHDKRYETIARESLQDFKSRVQITYLTDLSPDELRDKMKGLPERSVVIYVWQQANDDQGRLLETNDILPIVVASTTVPIYGQSSWHVGTGVIGGYVRSAESNGTRAAQLALRIAGGERAQDIPVEKTPVVPMFDWRQLQRWGISETSLPPGSIVRFHTSSFWDVYKWYVIGALSVFLVQFALIAGFAINRMRRRRAEQALRKSERKYRSIFDTTGVSIWEEDYTEVKALLDDLRAQGVTDLRSYLSEHPDIVQQGIERLKINDINQQTWKILGARTKAEVLDSLEQIFVPETEQSFAEIMIALSEGRRYLESETILRTFKGERREMFFTITFPEQVSPDDRVIVTLLDITERKAAEQSLKDLSGQLIRAREEECARIARELHDDINQRVALVSLELDQLRQAPPESPARWRAQVQEILNQAAELSSGIHRISRDLHPSKLTHLGLVAALRSLCAELSQSYGLEIEFLYSDVPPALSKEISLCIYRIGQESLNNVIKHSGAKSARVELSGSEEAIRLRVWDSGNGFDVEAARIRKGLGMVSMRERLRLVGGEISVNSRPSHGTLIEARVPLTRTDLDYEARVTDAARQVAQS